IPAYHRHVLSGCNGTIQITPKGIRFLSELEPHSRTWLYSEIKTVGGSDPFSFRVTTLAETYTFDLKQPLPRPAYDIVWQRVYDLQPKYSTTRLRPFLTGGHDEKKHNTKKGPALGSLLVEAAVLVRHCGSLFRRDYLRVGDALRKSI